MVYIFIGSLSFHKQPQTVSSNELTFTNELVNCRRCVYVTKHEVLTLLTYPVSLPSISFNMCNLICQFLKFSFGIVIWEWIGMFAFGN